MPPFTVDHLDHVAIRVRDVEVSADWYERTLGLRRIQPEEWRPYPVFLLAGTTGVALFPALRGERKRPKPEPGIGIDHFAFCVSRTAFAAARGHYERLGLTFTEQDHHYFRSLYTKDPDGHTVELTTLVVKAEDFFGQG